MVRKETDPLVDVESGQMKSQKTLHLTRLQFSDSALDFRTTQISFRPLHCSV